MTPGLKTLVVDVFGTVVDWTSIGLPSRTSDGLRTALRTAYVPRPLELGPGKRADPPDPSFDLVAGDFVELAEKLGAAR